LSVNVFEQVPIHELFTRLELTDHNAAISNQLTFNY